MTIIKPAKPSPLDTGFTAPSVGRALVDVEPDPPELKGAKTPAGAGASTSFSTKDGKPTPAGAGGGGGATARIPSGETIASLQDDKSRPPPRPAPIAERPPFKFRK